MNFGVALLLQIPALHFLAVRPGTAAEECLGLEPGQWDEHLTAFLKGDLLAACGEASAGPQCFRLAPGLGQSSYQLF